MRDEDRTREELLTDLQRIRMQMAGMEEAEVFRRRAERELEQMTHITSAIVRRSPCGLLILQRHRQERLVLLNANPQAAHLLAMTADGMRGLDFEDLWPGAAIQGLKQGLLNALDTGQPFEAGDVSYARDSLGRIFSVCAFRLPEDRLGMFVAEASERHVHWEITKSEDAPDETSLPVSPDASHSAQDRIDGDGNEDRAEESSAGSNDALVSRVEELSGQVQELSVQLLAAQESLAQETELRQAAEEGVETAWRELENRVAERIEGLTAANQSLERSIAESHAQEEALHAVQYELEDRLKIQETEIRELTETLEIEIEEHKKTEERLVTARVALESHMTDVDEELEAANELLKEQIVERRRTESELRSSLAERELLIHELSTQLAETTECLDRETARRTHIEQSLSGESLTPAPMQQAHLGYAALDIGGVITAFNARLLEIFGLTSGDDLRGINLLDSLIMFESGVSDAVKECLQSGVTCAHDSPFPNAVGEHRIARVHVAPLRQDSEQIIGCEAIFEDVSATRVKEGQLKRSERLHALSRMAGRVADTFNDMVQSISEDTQAAIACVESASFSDMVQLLEAMLAKSRDAGRTTRRIRQFARMLPRVETSHSLVFDLTDVVKESIDMDALWSKPATSEDGHDVVVEPILNPGCLVQGAEEDFIEVMANLLENAVEALPSGGKISVSTSLDREEILLKVSDEGVGIPRNHMANLFEPFWTTKDGHHGLGLCVVFGIVRRHGGTLAVHSEEGEGSTFTVKLPYYKRPPREESLAGEDRAQGNYRILLMYNLDPVAKMVRNKLTRLGHSVFIAQSVQDGVEVLKRTKIDAVVCDLAEEDSDSSSNVGGAIELLHVETGLPKPPIILLAESVDESAQSKRGACSNLNRIVEKPVSVARLIEIVEEEIRDIDSNFPAIDW